MFKKQLLLVSVLVISALSFLFVQPANPALETQLLVDASASTDYVPYTQTQWYSFSAIAGKGYCAVLKPSTGNSDLYFFDSGFNAVGSSKNTGTTQDRVWYGQSTSGPMHIACYGTANPSSNFTIQIITSPYVKTISPTSGIAGVLITLTGFGFGDSRGTSYVQFGSLKATTYYSWTNTQIKVYVPAGLSSGAVSVVVYVASRASNAVNFTSTGASSEGSMWRYDLGRSGNYPNGPAALPLNLKWTFVSDPTGAVAEPNTYGVVANNIVYVAADKLYALDANTGSRKWSYKTDGWVRCTPAVAKGIVYFGNWGGSAFKFYALDANTGAVKWIYNGVSCGESSPVIADNIVYFNAGYKMYALDANTGSLKWSYTVTGSWGMSCFSPGIANGVVYIGDSGNSDRNDKIYALDALTGAIKWIRTLTYMRANGTPAIVNSVLYVGTYDYRSGGGVLALDATTGTQKWYTPTSYWPATPTVVNGTIYLSGNMATSPVAFDANTGKVKWQTSLGPGTTCSFSKGIVYYGEGDNNVYALDANTGGVKWSYASEFNNSDASSPYLANGRIYTGSTKGKFYCFGQ